MTKRIIYLALTVFAFAFVSCGPDTTQMEGQVIKLAKLPELGTVEYMVSKIVRASDDATWYKFGDRKILFSCRASLKAGIDLSELSQDSVTVNYGQKSIALVLPKPKILSFNMKPDDIELVYEKTAITRFAFSATERDMIMTQGEKDIKESIPKMGILADAEKNAKLFLEAFLSQAGFSIIDIKFSKN
ncbi:MAG: DUF4230 domain-containing protein [Prevotellaceae bacterium]|jgi:hypothetical protein|nr:DUF4230 domain-containing protein [Prevotellaceae bacterium]